VLGVDSVTDNNIVIVDSVSSRLMGKGPGKNGAIDLIDLAADGGH